MALFRFTSQHVVTPLFVLIMLASCSPTPRHTRNHPMTTAATVAELTSLIGVSAPGLTFDCGAPIELTRALVNPADVPDRVGEWIELLNAGPVSLATDGLVVEIDNGRRRRRVYVPAGHIMLPRQQLRVGPTAAAQTRPLRLPNRYGKVTLVDACGWRSSELEWHRAAPGVAVANRPPADNSVL